MIIDAVYEINNFDQKYQGYIEHFYVFVGPGVKEFACSTKTQAIGEKCTITTTYSLEVTNNHIGTEQIRLDLIAGKLSLIDGTDYFNSDGCGKSNCCGKHKCECDISLLMTSGCRCNGC